MLRSSRSIGKAFHPNLESQNDEAYLTGRHTSQEKEKQIKTPLPRQQGPATKARRSRTK